MEGVNNRENWVGIYGNPLDYLHNFSANLKYLKERFILKTKRSTEEGALVIEGDDHELCPEIARKKQTSKPLILSQLKSAPTPSHGYQ